ncbi:hypothetical protein [Bacteroides sp.]
MKTTEKIQVVKPLRLHIQEFLDKAEAKYTLDEEHHIFSFNMENNGMGLNTFIIYNEEMAWMRCHMTLPVKVPKEKRERVLWEMNGYNYNNPGICISMDIDDGEVVVTMVANTDEGAINDRIINAMIFSCYNAFDACIPGIMRIIYQQPENILSQMANSNLVASEAN